MPYAAIAIHPSLPDGREAGTLEITASEARFTHAGGTIVLPLIDVAMRLGGSGDRLVFLESAGWPEGAIYTTDQGILRDENLLANPATASAVTRIGSETWRGRAAVSGIVAAVVLLIASLFWFRAPLAAAVARRIPLSIEKKLGDLAMKQVLLGAGEIDDRAVVEPLERVVNTLAASHPGASAYEFRVHVIDDPTVNAFALPGGRLSIHRGLLLEASTAEEISGVLAHEMAHVTEQHSLRQMISTVGLFALVQAFFGDASGLLAAAAEGGAQLAALGFSRDAEREADRVGLEMLRRARLDPGGMLTFFQTLHAIEQSRGVAGKAAEKLAFLSTHPATAERIETLRGMTEDSPVFDPRPVNIDMVALHAALRRQAGEVKR